MDVIDFWILDIAVRQYIDIRLLCDGEDRVRQRFNVECESIDIRECCTRVLDLHKNGMVDISLEPQCAIEGIDSLRERRWRGMVAEITSLVCGDALRLVYGLTPHGGSAWEGISHPDWTRMTSTKGEDSDFVVVECHSQSRLGEVVSWNESNGAEWKCVFQRTLRPWFATYWKNVSHGMRAIYQVRHLPLDCERGVDSVDSVDAKWGVWCKLGFSAFHCENVILPPWEKATWKAPSGF